MQFPMPEEISTMRGIDEGRPEENKGEIM